MKNQITLTLALLLSLSVYGQYSENFPIPNKGILSGPCSGSVGTSCLTNDFAGVNWTIEGNLSGIDSEPFATNGSNQLVVSDVDEEACWVSPLLDITAASASFELDLSWISYENYNDAGIGSKDYIDVEYSIDGGTWTTVENAFGSSGRTISNTASPSAVDGSLADVGASGLLGSTLQIRVCVDHNSLGEITTISNISAIGADLQGSGPTCDLTITDIVTVHEDCPDANDGSLTISTSTTNGPVTYSISGPISVSNSTGIFTDLPDGTYSITVDDDSFVPGTCRETASRTINAGVDNTDPTASSPPATNVVCMSEVPTPDPSIITDESDNCTIACTTEPWINEFHYDNDGTDMGEFVEIAGPAGLDLSAYTLYTYDGSDRMVDLTVSLSGIIDNESNGFGAISFSMSNLQNSTEGLALVKNPNTVIEFLSYEGTFIAIDGPAFGLTSTDVGVAEPNTQAVDESLSRTGSGNIGEEFTFMDQLATPGSLNGNQTIIPCPEKLPTVVFQGQTDNGGAGSMASPLVITHTYRVTDAAGNFIDVPHTINVIDNTPPTITCPSNVVVAAATGTCAQTVNFSAPTVGDNCAGTSTSQTLGLASGSSFSVGITGNTFQVTDAAGNTASCSFSVTVQDGEDPIADCLSPTIQLDMNGMYTLTAQELVGPGASDNCGFTPSISPTSFSCADLGSTVNVQLILTDAAGNTDDCTAQVTISDPNNYCNLPPTAVCQNIEVPVDANCEAVITAAQIDNGSSDPDMDPLMLTLDNSGPFAPGMHIVQLTVSDGSLDDMCSATISVVDNLVPALTCQNITVPLDVNGEADISATSFIRNNIIVSEIDNCVLQDQYITSGPTSFTCDDLGTMQLGVKVIDMAGNESSECFYNITITNPLLACNQAPEAICQNIQVAVDDNCEVTITAEDVDNGSFDPDADPFTLTLSDEGPFNPGIFQVTLTIDDGDKEDDCTATITVVDESMPDIQCPEPVVMEVNQNCEIFLPDLALTTQSSDNCTSSNNLTLSQSPATGTSLGPGEHMVTITSMDEAGNSNECTVMVTVQAGTEVISELICPEDLIVIEDCATDQAIVTLPAPEYLVCITTTIEFRYREVDATNAPLGTYSPFTPLAANTVSFDVGRYEVEWKVTDAFGSLDCSYFLQVDPVAPNTPEVQGPTNLCRGLMGIAYSVTSQPGISNYQWTYDGTGVNIVNNGSSTVLLDFASNASTGTLSAVAIDDCGNMSETSILEIEVGDRSNCSFVDCSIVNLFVSDYTLGARNSIQIFKVGNTISSDGTVSMDNSVVFKAGNTIHLLPGFEVEWGGTFTADIETCVIAN